MKQINQLEVNENLFQAAKKLYGKDNKRGKLLTDILNRVSSLDKEAHGRLVKLLYSMDPNLYKRSDYTQRIILNRVLLTHVLRIRSKLDDNLTSFIALLSYKSSVNEWKKVITQNIIPTLIKNKFL
jgi:hypothetical protein